MKFVLQHILLALILAQGCSWVSFRSAKSPEPQKKEPPLEVEVAQAFIKDGWLNTKIHLKAKDELDPTRVAVSLIGLKEGQVIGSKTKFLSEQYEPSSFEDGETAIVNLSLDAKDLTEYQVKCSWGEENQTHAIIELKEVTLDSYTENGNLYYTVSAKLVNNSRTIIPKARLALGIFWVNDGQKFTQPSELSSTAILDNEEIVNLDALDLPAGEFKQIRVKVDRPIPQVPGGQFIPNLRLLNSEVG